MIMLLNIIVSLVSVWILIELMKKDLGLFLLSFVILIQYIWMFFSLIVIEDGIFINEQGRNGYFVYSSLVLFCFYISTIVSLIFFKKIFLKLFQNFTVTRFKLGSIKEEKLTKWVLSIILIIAFISVISSPTALFTEKVTRFNYWIYARFPFLKSILGNVMGFVAFGSALLYRYNKKASIFFLIFYFVYLLLVGQKFSGFLIGSYGILLALYYSSPKKITFRTSWIFNKYLLLITASIFLLIWYKYTAKNPFRYMGLTPFEAIFYRAFGLQGHVFWGTVEQYVYSGKPNSWDVTELWSGMRVMMNEFWPWSQERFLKITERGVNWTNAYPAILLRIFPLFIAILINFLLTSFLSLIQTLLTVLIKNKSYLISIIFFQLLTWASFAYTMAYFNKLMIPFLILIIYAIYKYVSLKKDENLKQ